MRVKRWIAATLAMMAVVVFGAAGPASAVDDPKDIPPGVAERIGSNHNQVLL